MANFVVPQASAIWYDLGLQLFDPQDEGVLHSMKMEASKPPEEQCTEEVFIIGWQPRKMLPGIN